MCAVALVGELRQSRCRRHVHGVQGPQYNSDSMPRSRLTVALTRRRFAFYYGEISAKLEEVGLFFLYHPSGAITLKVRQL